MIITFFLFFIACVFSFYIPGIVLVDILRLKLKKSESFIISWITGVCLFILFTYLFAWINTSFLIFVVLFCCLVYVLRKRLIFQTIVYKNVDYWVLFLIIFGSLSFLSITFFSGLNTQDGLQFIRTNSTDGIVHLARVTNQIIFFPPQYPGLAEVEFRGYHYFYDFLLSRFAFLYHFSPLDLIFRFFPFFISLLYGCGFYLFSTLFTTDRIKKRTILFLAYFAQSAAFILLPLNNNYDIVQGGQLVQSISLILDPSIILSISLLLGGLFLLSKIKSSWKYGFLVGVIFGILSQLKIYAGVIGIFCLIIYSCLIFIRFKRNYLLNYLFTIILTGIISVATYFPNNLGIGSLVYAPFLIYRHYMEKSFFASLNWETKRLIFEEHNNVLRIMHLYFEAFIIFWVVNLGVRIMPILFIKRILSRKFWGADNNIILLLAVLTAVIIPTFFIQSISVFDIQQFNWIALVLLSIPAGLILGEVIQKKNVVLKIIVFFLFLVIIIQNLYFVFFYIFPSDKYIISQKDIRFYEKISLIVPQKSFIATLQENDIPLAAALSRRSTYYEKEMILFPLDDIYNLRKNNLVQLRKAIDECNFKEINNLMNKIDSKYLITPYESTCLVESSVIKEYIITENLAFYEFK